MRRAIALVASVAVACTNPQVTDPQPRAADDTPSSDVYTLVSLDDSLCAATARARASCRYLVLVPSGGCDPEHGAWPASSADVDGVDAMYRARGASRVGALCTVDVDAALCAPEGTTIDRNDRAWRACSPAPRALSSPR